MRTTLAATVCAAILAALSAGAALAGRGAGTAGYSGGFWVRFGEPHRSAGTFQFNLFL
jgi:hypothetical protein